MQEFLHFFLAAFAFFGCVLAIIVIAKKIMGWTTPTRPRAEKDHPQPQRLVCKVTGQECQADEPGDHCYICGQMLPNNILDR